jgi:hypothetical protein
VGEDNICGGKQHLDVPPAPANRSPLGISTWYDGDHLTVTKEKDSGGRQLLEVLLPAERPHIV